MGKSSLRRNARHEAAHAVASVRLGLPLASTDIRRGRPLEAPMRGVPSGVRMVTVGFTTLQEGTVEAFAAALPDPRSVEQLKRVAGQCAAGIAAEFENGASVNGPDSLAHRDDLQQLVQIAGTLGIGTSTDDVAVRVFIDSAVQLAQTALNGDDGVAWDRVTTALLRKKYLSGGEVRAIVAECPVTSSTCIGPKRN